MPQDGHGTPNRAGHEQAGNPSAWCVPKPCFEGSNDQETANRMAAEMNTTSPARRLRRISAGASASVGGMSADEARGGAAGGTGANEVTVGERIRGRGRWRTFRT